MQLAFSQGETPRANITCLKYEKRNDVAVSVGVFSVFLIKIKMIKLRRNFAQLAAPEEKKLKH
ncbi:hypothetical protein [Nodularia sp. NIES-3585]|uniref:hypothetical protein n=1 Tax=Nodularia sp. NIES-3585 TaxID=1973477 RepID=UPI000B5C7D66|nr:hypothetical protein [Nodularia sp. NIES-3585]